MGNESGPARGNTPVSTEQPVGLGAGRPCRLCLLDTRGIPGIFCLPLPLRASPAVGQPAVPVLHPPGGWTAGHRIPLSTGSYGMAGVGMLTASWLLCRAQHAPERLGYGVLWALMVLLMNMHDVSESVAGLAIALLTLMVCSSAGERVKRFWPRQFFVMFYAVHRRYSVLSSRCKNRTQVRGGHIARKRDKGDIIVVSTALRGETMIPLAYRIPQTCSFY